MTKTSLRFSQIRRLLQLFPSVHQLPDLPHEALMTVDGRLRGDAVVVEAGRRHRQFDLTDRPLAFRDLRLELDERRPAGIDRALLPPRLRLLALLIFARGL